MSSNLFRKKPVVVHAEQFKKRSEGIPGVYFGENDEHWVVTMHGDKIPVVPGDWIIREPDGEHYYPCKPEVFEATYEPVSSKTGQPDWRIGMAATPKLRTHPYFREVGVIRRINPESAHIRETMYVEVFPASGEPILLDEPTDEWKTA